MSQLSEAVDAYIRAEYFFRLGPDAYSKAAQDSLVAAEESLRKVRTGKRGLRNAAAVLDVPVEEHLKPKKQRQPKARVKLRIPVVLDSDMPDDEVHVVNITTGQRVKWKQGRGLFD